MFPFLRAGVRERGQTMVWWKSGAFSSAFNAPREVRCRCPARSSLPAETPSGPTALSVEWPLKRLGAKSILSQLLNCCQASIWKVSGGQRSGGVPTLEILLTSLECSQASRIVPCNSFWLDLAGEENGASGKVGSQWAEQGRAGRAEDMLWGALRHNLGNMGSTPEAPYELGQLAAVSPTQSRRQTWLSFVHNSCLSGGGRGWRRGTCTGWGAHHSLWTSKHNREPACLSALSPGQKTSIAI